MAPIVFQTFTHCASLTDFHELTSNETAVTVSFKPIKTLPHQKCGSSSTLAQGGRTSTLSQHYGFTLDSSVAVPQSQTCSLSIAGHTGTRANPWLTQSSECHQTQHASLLQTMAPDSGSSVGGEEVEERLHNGGQETQQPAIAFFKNGRRVPREGPHERGRLLVTKLSSEHQTNSSRY